MVAVRFGGDSSFATVASPTYLEGRARLQTPADLAEHVYIHFRLLDGRIYHWEFVRDGQALALDVAGQLTVNDSELLVGAALDGSGITFMPERYARHLIASEQLVSLLDNWAPSFPGMYLYYPSHRHVPPTLRAFIDVLKQIDAKR